ncbi:phosphotransferase family protein [Aspergillus costaricaensis CBS 115574]|uniref:Phosphotransferase family protein n=1 Tax=Aspergillus costaricaensis CBS 115574 TaxID=1448317 RepID=A0ACD1I6N4_9EURO|nr:phosphotransferase family protein [Aspergillus costaricaensis CBS 115574]RAK85935.1 phosphotransferase family protein [Aspergillus costaricaensis CBS 115574]
MGSESVLISLSHADAAHWNRELMLEFQATLEKDPAADLMSMFSEAYLREHQNVLDSQLSYAGLINRRVLSGLQDDLRPALKEKQEHEVKAPEFRERHLDRAETATVIYPLSDEVIALLAGCSRPDADQFSLDDEKSLVSSLRTLLWNSPQLWQSPVRGMVVKCNENVITKVITGNTDYTEYTSMQFLEKRAPKFLLRGPMGCLRQIRQKEGTSTLGGTCGEGVKELTVDECALFKGIMTTKEYSDLQFSARHHGSATYVGLLRSFLEHDTSTLAHESVFTHGDVRTDNVMVKQDPGSSGQYIVTGIIDWEDSGFYPFYYECTALTRTMSLVNENDWYLYLPQSISPSNFPVRWLVDRLWHIHLRTT